MNAILLFKQLHYLFFGLFYCFNLKYITEKIFKKKNFFKKLFSSFSIFIIGWRP